MSTARRRGKLTTQLYLEHIVAQIEVLKLEHLARGRREGNQAVMTEIEGFQGLQLANAS